MSGDAAHERHRRKDRDDRQRDGDDREADLVRGFERCAIRRFAHVHVAHDVLDLDDCVVDENAGRERDAEQADEIERKSHRADGPERRDRRKRQRNRRNQRRANVAQEEEHDKDGEHRALDERFHRRDVVAPRIGDGIVDLRELDVGIGGFRVPSTSRLTASETESSLVPLVRKTENETTGWPLSRAERSLLAGAIDDSAEILETNFASAGENNFGIGQCLQRAARRRMCG